MGEPVRLQKFISQSGRASRREAERMMVAGRVSVNGAVVTELGVRIDPDADVVAVDGEPVGTAEKRWVLFHKPPGVLTTRSDPHGGKTIYDVLSADLQGLRYVGRLDRDAEGLLLLTNDGELANRLAHPSEGVEREYWLEVAGRVSRDAINQLTAGVELEDGLARAARARLIHGERRQLPTHAGPHRGSEAGGTPDAVRSRTPRDETEARAIWRSSAWAI